MRLAIRTSSGGYGVGLFSIEGHLLGAKYGERASSRFTSVGNLFNSLLTELEYTPSAITEVVVDLGPGGLSSTRVGVSFSNAFCFGGGARLFGVSALDLQMCDARQVSELPILSVRPASGGNAFWAVYQGTTLLAAGCSNPQVEIGRQVQRFGRIVVTGPAKRLGLADQNQENYFLFDVDAPSLANFSFVPKRTPRAITAIQVLEPINSIEGLTYDEA